jgi:hypothetical protein
MLIEEITRTIKTINDVHGYGNLLGVVMDSDWKGGTATVQRVRCLPETRRFQFYLATGTVRFAGRLRSIDAE